MIDFDGYRPNVGIIICNQQGQVLWAKRCGQNSWQFPQGRINTGETAEQAMYRELYEEVGLSRQDVKILAISKVGCATNCRNAWCVMTVIRFVSGRNSAGFYCTCAVMKAISICKPLKVRSLTAGVGSVIGIRLGR